MSQFDAFIPDYENQELGLRVAVCADLAFIEIGTTDEARKDGVTTRTFTVDDKHSIGVDAELLLHVLTAAIRDADRDAIQRGKDGKLPIDHPQFETIPVTATGAIVRRRA